MQQAVVAVVRLGERVLMVQRGAGLRFAGYWQPLSGRLEPGETQAEAVVREAREEVGLAVRALRKVWECPADGADFVLHWWLAEPQGERLEPDLEEIADARWLTLEEIRALPRSFAGDREFFERIFPSLG